MVTDAIMCAVQNVIDKFETDEERNAGAIIWNMLSDFDEDEWYSMSDNQIDEWISSYITEKKLK